MLLTVLIQLSYDIPYIIIWLIGLILAVVWWQKHPRLSLLALIIFLLLIVSQIIISIVDAVLPEYMFQAHIGVSQLEIIINVVNLVFSLPAWALIIWAIFGWRKTTTPEGAYPMRQPQWGQPQAQPWPPQAQPWQPQPGQPPLPPQTPPAATVEAPPPDQG